MRSNAAISRSPSAPRVTRRRSAGIRGEVEEAASEPMHSGAARLPRPWWRRARAARLTATRRGGGMVQLWLRAPSAAGCSSVLPTRVRCLPPLSGLRTPPPPCRRCASVFLLLQRAGVRRRASHFADVHLHRRRGGHEHLLQDARRHVHRAPQVGVPRGGEVQLTQEGEGAREREQPRGVQDLPQKVRTCSQMTCAPSSRFARGGGQDLRASSRAEVGDVEARGDVRRFLALEVVPGDVHGDEDHEDDEHDGEEELDAELADADERQRVDARRGHELLVRDGRTCVIQPKTASPHVPSGRGRGGGRCVRRRRGRVFGGRGRE